MNHRRSFALSTFALLGLSACGGKLLAIDSASPGDASTPTDSSTTGSSSTPDAAAALPACTWPVIDRPDGDGGANGCTAGRVSLNCQDPNGGGELCLSDNTTACPPPGADSNATCVSQCAANEYAVFCSDLFPEAPPPVPPSGCRSAGVGAPESAIYCCPCGS